MSDTKSSPLAVPSVLYVAPRLHGGEGFIVRRGSGAGWFAPRGIRTWENEVNVVKRSALTDAVKKDLGVTMPEEQIPAAKLPYASKAAAAASLVSVSSSLKDKLTDKGVRVHTVGCDRISGGFYYFAEGGSGAKVSLQGDLIEMLGPSLSAGTSNTDLEGLLDGLIDRILQEFSGGELSELEVELAAALPKATADGTGMSGVDIDAFERDAAKAAGGADKFMNGAKDLAQKLAEADKKSDEKVSVPLFGEARRSALPALEIEVGGERRKLAARHEWIVTGAPKLDAAAPAKTEAKPAAKAEEKKVEKKEAAPAAKAATPKPATAKETPKAEAKKAEEKPKTEAKKIEEKPKAEEKKAEAKKEEAKAAEKADEKKAEEPKAKAAEKAEEKKAEPKEEKKEEKKTAPRAEDRIAAKASEKGETKKSSEKKAETKKPVVKVDDEITEKKKSRDQELPVKSSGPSPIVWFIVAAVVAAIAWVAFFRH